MSRSSHLRRAPFLLGLLALFLLAGCAARGGADGVAPADAVSVVVNNNLIPPTSLTVYAVPDTGVRERIGVVPPSETRTLSYRGGVGAGQVRFVAETTAGNPIVSNPITVGTGEGVKWDLQANLVTPL